MMGPSGGGWLRRYAGIVAGFAMTASCAARGTPPERPPASTAEAADLPVHAFAALRLRTSDDMNHTFGEAGSYEVRTDANAAVSTISSCRELLALPLGDVVLEPDTDPVYRSFWSLAVDCVALQTLLSARPSQRSLIAPLLSAADPTQLLPPSVGLSDFMYFRDKVQQAEAQCQSWKAFDDSLALTARNEDGFSIRADIWWADVKFFLRGDVDGDGYEDLVVRRYGHATEGSYAATALLVLSRTDADACIRVTREIGQS